MHVLVLTQHQCAFCAQAQVILDRLSADYGFTVATLDVRTPEGEALALANGMLFPPGIFVDGEALCYGRPSERKLRKEFERRSQSIREHLGSS